MRLIDANSFIGFLHNQEFIDGDDRSRVYRWIEEQPTIEPEQRYGRWIALDGWFNKSIVKCSVCGNTLNMDGVNAGRCDANFCPNCGADMREVIEDAGTD